VKLAESRTSGLKRARAIEGPLELDSANFGHLSIRPIENWPFAIRPNAEKSFFSHIFSAYFSSAFRGPTLIPNKTNTKNFFVWHKQLFYL
jgi:hypothetical protein